MLLLKLKAKKSIRIGKLGTPSFARGYYAYVGSAKKNGYSRLNRHWLEEKKIKWHIDYLREEAKPVALYVFDQEKMGECSLAQILSESFNWVDKFGSSDCNCSSHLYYSQKSRPIRRKLEEQKGLVRVIGPRYQMERRSIMKEHPEKLKLLFERRSIRKYTEEAIPREVLQTILEAGLAAPSASDRRPWHLTVITKREELDALAEANPYGKMLKLAPAAILVSGDQTRMREGAGRDFWIQDCAAVTQNILLAIQALGLGGVWIGQHPVAERKEGAKNVLQLADNLIPFSLISFGYPAETKEARTRLEESQVAWRN